MLTQISAGPRLRAMMERARQHFREEISLRVRQPGEAPKRCANHLGTLGHR